MNKYHTEKPKPSKMARLTKKVIIFLCKKSIRKIIRLIIEKLINKVDACQLIEVIKEFFENFD